jgi:hypothetical protein
MARSERFAPLRVVQRPKTRPIEIGIRLYGGYAIYFERIAELYQGVRRSKRFDHQSRRLRYGEIVQHPAGGATPGVATAPVAFAGAIMAGLASSIEMFSLQAAEFGVGIAVVAGSMLVPPRPEVGD